MSNFYKVRSWNAGAWDLEEEYELKKEIAKKYGISFLRLTVEQGILQSVWFDQRLNLKSDMGKLTIAINELKSNITV